MQLLVAHRRTLTPSITEFVLTRVGSAPLPRFSPGAHISVETPSGAMRRYSLVNNGLEPDQYIIAVKREASSRGGSQSMHDNALIGTTLQADEPDNDFSLSEASRYLLIAGGIGITPIFAMAKHLLAEEKPFRLIYCTRTPADTAYHDEIQNLLGERMLLHHDGGDPAKVYDFWNDLEKPNTGHVYCCGPAPLMEDIKSMSGHWPEGRIHFEDFKPVEIVRADDKEFTVTLARSGKTITVSADRSILEALREAGIKTASSCESGTCGTCKTKLKGGMVDHRDMVLEEHDKQDHIMICVSRAAAGDLVLDL